MQIQYPQRQKTKTGKNTWVSETVAIVDAVTTEDRMTIPNAITKADKLVPSFQEEYNE